MKSLFFTLLIFCTFSSHADTDKIKSKYKKATTILEQLKKTPDATIKGPFLLTIKSVTQQQLKVYLNTEEDPNASNNISIELPPFIQNHYKKHFNSDIKSLFLNQNIIVKGQVSMQTHQADKSAKKTSKQPTIKIIFTDQLAHYD